MPHLLKAIKYTNLTDRVIACELIRRDAPEPPLLVFVVSPWGPFRWLAGTGGEIVAFAKDDLVLGPESPDMRLYWDTDFIEWLDDGFDVLAEVDAIARYRAGLLGDA